MIGALAGFVVGWRHGWRGVLIMVVVAIIAVSILGAIGRSANPPGYATPPQPQSTPAQIAACNADTSKCIGVQP